MLNCQFPSDGPIPKHHEDCCDPQFCWSCQHQRDVYNNKCLVTSPLLLVTMIATLHCASCGAAQGCKPIHLNPFTEGIGLQPCAEDCRPPSSWVAIIVNTLFPSLHYAWRCRRLPVDREGFWSRAFYDVGDISYQPVINQFYIVHGRRCTKFWAHAPLGPFKIISCFEHVVSTRIFFN